MNTREKVSFITLSEKKKAPKVGTYIEHKNAIIIKKYKGNKIEVFYTDQNGLVMKAAQGGGGNPENVETVIKSFLEENSITIKNALNLTPSYHAELDGNVDIIFRHNDERKTISAEDFNLLKKSEHIGVTYYYGKGDKLEIRGEDYPKKYVKINTNAVVGKNITRVVPIEFTNPLQDGYYKQGLNRYTLSVIELEDILERNINFVFKEDGEIVEQLNEGLKHSVKFNKNSYNDNFDIDFVIKSGLNTLYGVDGELSLTMSPIEGKILEIKPANGEGVLYKGMPINGYTAFNIADNIRDIEVNLRDERVGQADINFTIENNLGMTLNIVSLPKLGQEDAPTTTIVDGVNSVFFRESGKTYNLIIKPDEESGMRIARSRIDVKNAETKEILATEYSWGYNELLIIHTPISIDISNIEIVINNN